MTRDLALVVGVGESTGQAVCRLLAYRYRLVMVARSRALIETLAAELPDAHALPCDVADRDAWGAALRRIRDEFGVPTRILVNTEAAVWGAYDALALDRFAASFDVNVVSLLQLVQVLFPNKDAISAHSRILVSSSPAAYHPPAQFLGLAPSRVAQRVLAELLHENLAPHGLALSVFSINGAIDQPSMRALYPNQPASFFVRPGEIAAAMVKHFDSADFPRAIELRGESAFV